MTDQEGYKWLEMKLTSPSERYMDSKLFQLLKKCLSQLGHWRNRSRGNPGKGYKNSSIARQYTKFD